ncbi:hypothetical protein L9F63_018533 [Diploptera punctata]|uniref:Ionotropic glutamate receptor C-terminal domain-containing protein n=1 Tax=Diploptera punctata TaxID=6984 RepID=A0AAD7ZXA8_DIPPU|nr:hypothetical protein L9F63_018533 [Diploptera punctata]
MLKHMHSISSWTITVGDLNSRCKYETEKLHGFIFVIHGNKLEDIRMNQRLISNLSFQRAKTVIIIIGTLTNINIVYTFLNEFSLRDAIVIYHYRSRYLKILMWPSDECGNLKHVPIYSDCIENKYISKQINKIKFKKSDRKCKLHIRGFHNPPFSIFTGTDTVAGGIELKLISIIANKLGIEIKNTAEVTDSTRNMVILGHQFGFQNISTIKYMSRFYTETYTWIVPRCASHPHWSNITKVFKIETWLLLLSTLMFVSATMKYANTSNNTDIFKCIFTSWGVFLNIPVDEISKKTRVRIIFITWILMSIALTIVFQAFMTSYFTDPGKIHQINTFDELEQSNLKLSLTEKAFLYDNILYDVSKPNFLMFPNDCQMLEFCFRNSSVAALTTEERFLYNSQLYFHNVSTSLYHMFTEDGISFHRTLNMYAMNPYVEAVNKITINLVEGGIVNKIVETFLDASGWIRGRKMGKTSIHEYESLSMFHMTSAFMYLVFGYALSFAVFIFEFVYCKLLNILV